MTSATSFSEGLKAAVKPWADYHGDLPDYDHPLRCVFESGIQYTVELLAKMLRVEEWTPCDGTEEFDGDLGGTLMNIVLEAMPKDEHGDALHPSELHTILATRAAPEKVTDGEAMGDVVEALIECRRVLFARIPRIGPEGPNNVSEQAEYEEVGGAWSMADSALRAHLPNAAKRDGEAVGDAERFTNANVQRLDDGDYGGFYIWYDAPNGDIAPYVLDEEHARDLHTKLGIALSAAPSAPTPANLGDALAWFSTQHALELSHKHPVYGDDDDQDEEWQVHRQSGPVNDREWDLVGRGETASAAILDAYRVAGLLR